MKTATRILAVATVLLFASTAWAQISGSSHDFSGEVWSGGEICKPCHTPHNGDTTLNTAPLWNHTLTTGNGGTWQTYVGPGTLNATDMGTPSGVSLLCLSCHDGTVAVDAFGGSAGSTTIAARANVSTDLRNDHPVSFTYDTALSVTDPGLRNPASATSNIVGGTTIQADLLFSNKLECASCHDVHNGGGSTTMLLRVSNAGSQLCLTCHNK